VGAQEPAREVYAFSLPALVVSGAPLMPPPASHTGSIVRVGLKGELTVACQATGCEVVMMLAEDGSVSGRLDRRGVAAGGGALQGNSCAAAVSLGVFTGSWRDANVGFVPSTGGGSSAKSAAACVVAVMQSCSGSGGGSTATTALSKLDLQAVPCMRLARLWCAILDNLSFINPAASRGPVRVAHRLGCLPACLRA
jgi:hypothetical protein